MSKPELIIRDKRDLFADVFYFQAHMGLVLYPIPTIPSEATMDFRESLIAEEYTELMQAMLHNDLPEIADGIADLIYVLLGTAASCGIDIRPIWATVHAANMAKGISGTGPNEKILKPEGWEHPQIEKILHEQPAMY